MFDFEYNKNYYRLEREHLKYNKVARDTNFINIFNDLITKLKTETPKYSQDYSQIIISCIYTWPYNEDVLETYKYETILPHSIDGELSPINITLEEFSEMLKPNQLLDYYKAVDYYEINILKFIPEDNSPEEHTDIYLELLLYRDE